MVEVHRSKDSELVVLAIKRLRDQGSERDLEIEREQGNKEKLKVRPWGSDLSKMEIVN